MNSMEMCRIAIIVPAYHEEGPYLSNCLESLGIAMGNCPCGGEIYVAENIKGIGAARNFGASQTTSEILVFVDADCTVSPNFLREVYEKARNPMNVGGGTKWVHLDRYSLSTLLALIPIGIKLYRHQITIGAFWVRRECFNAIGGFDDTTVHELDYDFARRVKVWAESHGRKFRSLKQSYIIWSTRGTKKYGEWFWIKRYREYRSGI